MDWTTPLRSQQADFVERLKLGHLLSVPTEGLHSEAIAIAGENLEQLQKFCWQMAAGDRAEFRIALTRKLARAALTRRLDDFLHEIPLQAVRQNNLFVDFALTTNPSIGIRLQTYQGLLEAAKWSINREETTQNAVLVCVFICEEVEEDRTHYNLAFTGFLPTNMIQPSDRSTFFAIDNLLYIGGLQSYLESLNVDGKEKIELADTSSLSNWLPALTPDDLASRNQDSWKQEFIRWVQDLAIHAPSSEMRLYLYDLLNTQYYRQTLWKLYYDRERQLGKVSETSEIALILERTNAKAEDVMFELAGLSKDEIEGKNEG